MAEKTATISEQNDEKKRVRRVWLSYVTWFLVGFGLAYLAITVADFFNTFYLFPGLAIKILKIFGFALEAAALGQRGYDIRTWCGESSAEKLNEKLFVWVSSIGFVLVIFSFHLKSL
ncbi:MAG: hypothetical protein QNJ27_03580 [Simkaniaceae bacterium]|nr:hypothetical protein [Simkaniaceae bacterium]